MSSLPTRKTLANSSVESLNARSEPLFPGA